MPDPARDYLMGLHSLKDTTLLILCPSHFIHKTKRYGDKRLPCLTPLAVLNFLVGTPFHKICIVKDDIADIITFCRKTRIPTALSEATMKSQQTLS